MISNRSRPTEFSQELYDYYLRRQNGRKLLEGVKVVPEKKRDEAERVAGQSEVSLSLCSFARPVLVSGMCVRA